MRIKISERNSKIGPVPNISFPPGKSCILNAPCFCKDGCYAIGPYTRWPNVRNAWDFNLDLYYENPDLFMEEFSDYLYMLFLSLSVYY